MKNDGTAEPREAWPAGHPDEASIRASIAHSLERVPCRRTISRGDLARLDNIVSFFDALGEFAPCDLYDDAWNLRNHLVPFKPGDKHHDPECE